MGPQISWESAWGISSPGQSTLEGGGRRGVPLKAIRRVQGLGFHGGYKGFFRGACKGFFKGDQKGSFRGDYQGCFIGPLRVTTRASLKGAVLFCEHRAS